MCRAVIPPYGTDQRAGIFPQRDQRVCGSLFQEYYNWYCICDNSAVIFAGTISDAYRKYSGYSAALHGVYDIQWKEIQ